jgi:hypothetical protein
MAASLDKKESMNYFFEYFSTCARYRRYGTGIMLFDFLKMSEKTSYTGDNLFPFPPPAFDNISLLTG